MKKAEILKVIEQLEYEVSMLDIDEERLIGVDVRIEELKDLLHHPIKNTNSKK